MNAIILAAGLGSRFKEVTKDNHKALLPIGGTANIERTILYLKEIGIHEIIIVTGHKAELFQYLKDKFNVTLVFNEHYAEYNNIYSFYEALDYFHNSYIIDADVVILKNIFTKSLQRSQYFTVQREESTDIEWCPVVEGNKVVRMDITSAFKPSLLGISYWNEHDSSIIKNAFSAYMNPNTLTNSKLYWDNIPVSLLDKLDVTTNLIDSKYVDEMDTVENYKNICKKYDILNQ